MKALKQYAKVLATFAMVWVAFLLCLAFFGLCFYEGPFELKQVAMQVGGQVLIVIVGGLLWLGFSRMWISEES